MAEATFEEFQKRIAKHAEENFRKRVDVAPPPGMRPDGTVEILAPGQPKPQPSVSRVVSGRGSDQFYAKVYAPPGRAWL